MGANPFNISASRGAAFLGVSKYKSPLEAWLEIMEERKPGFCAANGYIAPVRKDPFVEPLDPALASMRWGLAFESAICTLAGGLHDRERAYICPGRDYLTCHIDGRDDYGTLNENKTVFDMAYKSGWGEPGTDLVPVEYQVQVQHQMLCTGDKTARLNALVFPKAPAEWEKAGFSLVKNGADDWAISRDGISCIPTIEWARAFLMIGNFHVYNLVANEAAQKEMLERYEYIWNENILKEVPPPVQGYADIKWLFNAPSGEIEADDKIRELWQESIDIDTEIESMICRKDEIKNIFAQWVGREMMAKHIREGGEPRKLNIYAGQRKLFTISKPEPGVKVSRSSVDTLKDDYPELYEDMKKTSFADILGEVEFTEKQAENIAELDAEQEKLLAASYGKLKTDIEKFLGKKKLSALLSRDSIIHAIEKSKPELYATMMKCGILETTEPVARLTIKKPTEE